MGAPGFSGSATGQSITPSSSLASSSQQRQVKPVSRKKNTDETLFKGFTFTEESMLKERYQAEKQMLKDRSQLHEEQRLVAQFLDYNRLLQYFGQIVNCH